MLELPLALDSASSHTLKGTMTTVGAVLFLGGLVLLLAGFRADKRRPTER